MIIHMAHSNCISSHLSLHANNKLQLFLSLCLLSFSQTSELTEVFGKQVKISPGPVPLRSSCFPRHLFASLSFVTFLFKPVVELTLWLYSVFFHSKNGPGPLPSHPCPPQRGDAWTQKPAKFN